MKQENGYLRIELKSGEAVCMIYPPCDGGFCLDYKEAVDYLTKHGYDSYDKRELRRLLEYPEESKLILGDATSGAFGEEFKTVISLDKMEASIYLYPPTNGGSRINVKDVMTALGLKSIRSGIDQETILELVEHPVYFTNISVAQGKQPVNGRNAFIEYFFNTDLSTKPSHNEDGSVDFHNLNTICAVEKGELLAELHPAEKGSPGMNVVGVAIPPVSVRELRLDKVPNTYLSEDGLKLYSDVTGHASLVNDKIFVSDIYEVPGDVDNSTGNIIFEGNVHIAGSVRGGFSVIAKGDVVIDGVVEDALVQSEGQIIVRYGIHGMHKGILDAGSNVITKFIENAKVYSGGYIETGSILYSEVSAGNDVIVSDRKGFISGGIVRAGGKVEAMTIGSEMGASTMIEVGLSPDKKERYLALQTEMSELGRSIAKLKPIVKNYNDYIKSGQQLDQKNTVYLQKVAFELKRNTQLLENDQAEFEQIHKEMMAGRNSCVDVRREIHPGVTVTVSDVSVTVKEARSFCRFSKKDGVMDVSNL